MIGSVAPLSRRGFFAAAGALALAGRASASVKPRPVLRVVHLTDLHIQPELKAGEGVVTCLHHVQEHAKPDLILTGGDHIMDAFAQPLDRTKLQWELYAKTLKAENSVPVRACVGNHDIWGWNKNRSGAIGDEANYGKKYATEALSLDKAYYSFDQGGWHFIALDGVQPGAKPGSYSAYLDDEQKAWLTADLAQVPATTPVLIWTHIPVVSVMPMFARRQEPTAQMTVAAGTAHTDAGDLVTLFTKHPNVKACLSGHLHLIDHVQVRGVNFHCNGAVSGKWWRGPNAGFDEGYTVVDLFADGTYTNTYVSYGWKAANAEEKKS